jgi:uncharacterized protein (DUF2141 family)
MRFKKMNKKIFTLLLLVFVLISISAVSSADLNDTDSTLALDDSSDIVAVSNESSDVLKISENQNLQQASDSENDVLGISPTLTINSCPTELDVGADGQLKCELAYMGMGLENQVVWLNVDGVNTVSTKTTQEDVYDGGLGFFTLNFDTAGTYTVKCVFEGNTGSNYDPCESDSRTVTVTGGEPAKTSVHISDYTATPSITMTAGDSMFYTPTVEDAGFNNPVSGVTVKLTAGSNVVTAVSGSSGVAGLDLSGVSAGDYTASVVVDDANYEAPETLTFTLTVNPKAKSGAHIENTNAIQSIEMNEGDDKYFAVTVLDINYMETGGINVKLTADENTVTAVSGNDGIARIDLSGISPGTYTASVVVDDANYEAPETVTFSLTVNGVTPQKTTVHISDYTATSSITMDEGDSVFYSPTVEDINWMDPVSGVTVKLTAGSNVVTAVSGSDGVAALDLSGVPAGTYTASIVVDDANYEAPETLTLALTVNGDTPPASEGSFDDLWALLNANGQVSLDKDYKHLESDEHAS